MKELKKGDKVIYLNENNDIEVEILDISLYQKHQSLKNYYTNIYYRYLDNDLKFKVIINDRIEYINEIELFHKNSQEYTNAKIELLDDRIKKLENRGFFRRIFN